MHTKETMEKKYNIIYADPPWRYDMNRGQGAAENHYPTMSIQEICRLPVAELAAGLCFVFMGNISAASGCNETLKHGDLPIRHLGLHG